MRVNNDKIHATSRIAV